MQKTKDASLSYLNLVREGKVDFNADQLLIANRLKRLENILWSYKEQMGKSAWVARLKLGKFIQSTPKGIYIWGGVGCGKTMIMNLFFESSA